MKLTVNTLRGTMFEIQVQPSDTIMAVKKNIEETLGKDDSHPWGQQGLIFNGKVLKNESTLDENKVNRDGFFVVLVLVNKSKTSGSSGPSSAQEQTEAIMAEPTEEGQDPKTATEAVAEVLPSSSTISAVRARVQELKAEVQAEKQDSAALRCQIEYQRNELESLKLKIEKSEVINQKQQEELDSLKKQREETNSLLRLLLRLNKE